MCHNVRLVNDKIYVKTIKCRVHTTSSLIYASAVFPAYESTQKKIHIKRLVRGRGEDNK